MLNDKAEEEILTEPRVLRIVSMASEWHQYVRSLRSTSHIRSPIFASNSRDYHLALTPFERDSRGLLPPYETGIMTITTRHSFIRDRSQQSRLCLGMIAS